MAWAKSKREREKSLSWQHQRPTDAWLNTGEAPHVCPKQEGVKGKVEVKGSRGRPGGTRYHLQSRGREDTFSWPRPHPDGITAPFRSRWERDKSRHDRLPDPGSHWQATRGLGRLRWEASPPADVHIAGPEGSRRGLLSVSG